MTGRRYLIDASVNHEEGKGPCIRAVYYWRRRRQPLLMQIELHVSVYMFMSRRPRRVAIQAGARAVSRFLARALPGQLVKAMAATSRSSLALAPDEACMEMPAAMVAR